MKISMVRARLACFAMVLVTQAASLPTLDDLQVSMLDTSEEEADGVHLFGISVKNIKKGNDYIVKHRYSDFNRLKDNLDVVASRIPNAPFPGRFIWPWPTPEMIEDRRKALETWLQQVLHLSKIKGSSWKKPLQTFLEEGAPIGITWRDTFSKLAKSVNDSAHSAKSHLAEWLETSETTEEVKKDIEDIANNITSESKEMEQDLEELKALVIESDAIKAELDKAKEAAGDDKEIVQVVQDKLDATDDKINQKAKEIEGLKEDIQELKQKAQATMEKSLKETKVTPPGNSEL